MLIRSRKDAGARGPKLGTYEGFFSTLLRELQAEGTRLPEGIPLDELALRVLIATETGRIPRLD